MSVSPKSRRNQESYDDGDEFESQDSASQNRSQEATKQFFYDVLSRWHWLALFLILGVLAGFYYLSKAPKLYTSHASLLINQQASTVLQPDQMAKMDLRTLDAMNTITERVTRKELLEKVAARPELRALPGLVPLPVIWLPEWSYSWFGIIKESPDQTVVPSPVNLGAAISYWITVEIRKGTRILDIVVTHESPEVAREIANAICAENLSELKGKIGSDRNKDLAVLKGELEVATVRLQSKQNALAIYQRALMNLKDLEMREAVLADLSRRYLGKHPKMVAAQSDLKTYQARFLVEFEAARSAPADRSYWESNAAEWNALADNEAEKLLLARRLLIARGTVLESEIGSQNIVFNNLSINRQKADINQQSIDSEMEINSMAELPDLPTSPAKIKVLAICSIGGMALGFVLTLGLIRLDNKIHTVAQVERETGYNVLAAISKIEPGILADLAKKSKAVEPESEEKSKWSPMLLFRPAISSTMFTEMFRILRASVSLLGDEKKRKITLFTSALPGEGKSFVTSNFALASAQQGKKTLLIDLDLRKPSIHKLFGLKRDFHPNGASDVLSNNASFEEGILKNTGQENLHIMLAGKKAPAAGELLNSNHLEQFLKNATDRYEVVVIDSAPLLAVPDTRLIVPLIDNFCLVTRADYLPKGALRRVLALLDNDRIAPNGIVFNSFAERRRLIGQNYSYGSYQTNKYGKAYRYGYGSYGVYGSDNDD